MAGSVVEFTDANWKTEVLESQVPVVVDFWAPWCGPCRMLAPTIEKLAGEYVGKVKIGKMNTDEDEFLQCVVLPFRKALAMVRRGEIKDSKTVIGLLSCAVNRRLY